MTNPSHDILTLMHTESAKSYASSHPGWKSGTNPCEWYGVSCDDQTGLVTKLSLTGATLAGSLPSELGRVTTLKELILVNCGLTGTIPREIAELPSLETIDLSLNQLTGTIPLFESTQMQRQLLSSNSLSGHIHERAFSLSDKLQMVNYRVSFVYSSSGK